MIKTYKTEIIIPCDKGEIRLSFSPAQPRGYTALSESLLTFEAMRKKAEEISKGDKALAGAFIIDGEMKSLTEMKEALHTALLPSEWEKIAPFIDYVDITGMIEIVTAIVSSYSDYYTHRLKDGLED